MSSLFGEAADEDGRHTAEENTARCHARGVSVEFLVAFTFAHDCWDMPTWQVQRDIIKPATFDDGRWPPLPPDCCCPPSPRVVSAGATE